MTPLRRQRIDTGAVMDLLVAMNRNLNKLDAARAGFATFIAELRAHVGAVAKLKSQAPEEPRAFIDLAAVLRDRAGAARR